MREQGKEISKKVGENKKTDRRKGGEVQEGEKEIRRKARGFREGDEMQMEKRMRGEGRKWERKRRLREMEKS